MNLMQLYPQEASTRLEFDKLLHLLSEFCYNPIAKERAIHLKPSTVFKQIETELEKLAALKELLESGEKFPRQSYFDVSEMLNRLAINDMILESEDLLLYASHLETVYAIYRFFLTHSKQFTVLGGLIDEIALHENLLTTITQVIDDDGNVKTEASPELKRLRSEQIGKLKELDKVFRKVLKNNDKSSLLGDVNESIRNGRRVLAVKAENKRTVKGIIHDESESGKTVFIEPEETVFLNNQLFELERQERREIVKILHNLCNTLRAYLPELKQYHELLIQADLLYAKVSLAQKTAAQQPKLVAYPCINLIEAYHPLLYLNLHSQKKKIVKHQVSLDHENRILLISGPNAGGKSVALKTVALLQLMVQSGLLPSCHSNSVFGVFNQLFAELGDNQSIDNQLSTYSSHLTHMNYFLKHVNEKTLIFIDEFGTGTDPRIGGAIAEAVLQELTDKKTFGLINTHYGNLKTFAENHAHIQNASMLFDEEKLSPTYILKVGKPGSSYAIEIARRSGLPENVLQKAKKLVGKSDVKLEEVLNKMGMQEKELEEKHKHLNSESARLQKMIQELNRQHRELNIQQKQLKYEQLLNKQKEAEIKKATIEAYLKQLEQKQLSSKEATKQWEEVQEQLKDTSRHLVEKKREIHKPKQKVEVKPGLSVTLLEGDEVGKVLEIRNKTAIVAFGLLKTQVNVADLIVVDEVASAKSKTQTDVVSTQTISEIDLRGKSKAEVIAELDDFIDKAILNDVYEIRILHGKGSGVLRNTVVQILHSHKNIESYHHPEDKQGGNGVTLAKIR